MSRASWDLRLLEGMGLNPPATLIGHEDGTFVIDADSGNLTMTRSVPRPKTFFLLVKVGPLARSPWVLPESQDTGLTLQGPAGHCCFPHPKAEQADHARYSVTQVTVDARNASGSLPRFPLSLYRGMVALGSGVGVAVKDTAVPSQLLRIRAQDPEFPVGPAWVCLASPLGWVGGYGGPELTRTVSRTSTQPSRIKSPTTPTSEWTGRLC